VGGESAARDVSKEGKYRPARDVEDDDEGTRSWKENELAKILLSLASDRFFRCNKPCRKIRNAFRHWRYGINRQRPRCKWTLSNKTRHNDHSLIH